MMVAMFAATASAQGQSLSDHIRAKIPFDFVVGDKKLPAGEYSNWKRRNYEQHRHGDQQQEWRREHVNNSGSNDDTDRYNEAYLSSLR
jgi:hypothetical protein